MTDSAENKPKGTPLIIEYKEGAMILHLNIRKQGNDDNKILAVDIKLHGVTSSQCLHKILGCEPHQALRFWEMNPEAVEKIMAGEKVSSTRPIFTGLDSISSWASFENIEMQIEGFRRSFQGVKVKKFRFLPTNDTNIVLTMSASISDIDSSDLARFSDMLQEKIFCRFEGQPELALDGDDKPAKANKRGGSAETQQGMFDDDGGGDDE